MYWLDGRAVCLPGYPSPCLFIHRMTGVYHKAWQTYGWSKLIDGFIFGWILSNVAESSWFLQIASPSFKCAMLLLELNKSTNN